MVEREDSIFDFGLHEDQDPSLSDGFRVVYDREVPIEIRQKTASRITAEGGATSSSMESIKVKVLIQGPEDIPIAIRVELSSEADLFFYHHHSLDEAGFQAVKESQHLTVDFSNYAAILIRMLNSCIREPHIFLAVYSLISDDSAKLDLIQNMEYKYVELLSCSFVRSPEEVVQNQITYRYNSMKHRLANMQGRVHEIVNLVKTKNPSLLLQLQKNPPMSSTLVTTAGGGSGGSVANANDRRR